MAIALNAGSNQNGQTPSVGVYGDGNVTEKPLLGNFGDLLNLISEDAQNALHENKPAPQLTATQTSEALLAFAEVGGENTRLAISTILQRAASENSDKFYPTETGDIRTSSFLEAKIENKLEQQNLLKPEKILELFSLKELKDFGKDFELMNAEVLTADPLNEKMETLSTPILGSSDGLVKEQYEILNFVVPTTASLMSNTTDTKRLDTAISVEEIGTPFLGGSDINAAEIGTPFLGGSDINTAEIGTSFLGGSEVIEINNPNLIKNYPLNEKNQIILDAVNDILQVDAATLYISTEAPSEVIFDLRDLKQAIVQKFSLPSTNTKELKVPLELVIPYTLPITMGNKSTENLLVNVDESKFDTLEVTKITLDSNLIELPVPGENNGVENTFEEQKSFTVKGGELLLSANPALERKLVVGIVIPKGSSTNELPDFVKIQINMDDSKVLAEKKPSNLNINKEYLTSNVIEFPKNSLNDDNPSRLVKNIQALVTSLDENNNEYVEDRHIVSINKLGKISQKLFPNLESRETSAVEVLSNNLANRSLQVLSNLSEKSTVPEHFEPKVLLSGADRLSVIPNESLIGAVDTKKYNAITRATTSVLALGANTNFFINNNKSFRDSGIKEKTNTFSSQANMTGDSAPETIFEIFNNKNVNQRLLNPTEINKIFQPQNDIATAFPAGHKLITSPLLNGERVLSINNMPSASALVESKISLYEAQYASRLGMAVVEKVRAGQENFDIHLQPESFGKIKINVNLDFRAIDVKIFTETLGAAAIFKDHENTLQQIMEQNGMKLASFTVGSQNSNDQQRQFANQNKDRLIGKTNGRGNKIMTTSNQSESPTGGQSGLNLIA